ncbi:MAG: UDP-N-acetylglucosamine diphosphorylase/glucosamine-1-phosphate N-acetyltransferase [Chloroflexi bacterium]|nr:MAG: UDP-N-acetylglucosamine diphosphorylase/glucosamine-1-phosphate N-acetyltransferase [Chloroflexota bacterium]
MSAGSALILAAGKGTRMRSVRPKVLHTLAGIAMIDLVVDAIRGAGATPTVVVSRDADTVREHLDGVATVVQDPPLGTGHAVQVALPVLPGEGEAFIVYGDTPLLRAETLRQMQQLHRERGAVLTLLSARVPPPSAYGIVERATDGTVTRIVETKPDPELQRTSAERNLGAYVVDLSWLRRAAPRLQRNASGEVYLTDLPALAAADGKVVAAFCLDDPREGMGVNSRDELAAAEALLRARIRERHMLAGVTLRDPASTFIDAGVSIGEDTELLPGTILEGQTRIGRGCVIGPRSRLRDTIVGDRSRIGESYLEGATLEEEVSIGPYCHIRTGTYLARGVDILDHAEIKNSRLGRGTKVHHFSYLGDATIGADVNVGAGTITANYDGKKKLATVIEDGVFLGVDTMLVAPVRIGRRAKTGAGAVVTKDVAPGMLAVGVPARAIKRVVPEADLQ